MASGTISGSPRSSVTSDLGGGKIMRSAIRNKITPPPICSDSSLRPITRKNPSPTNMKVSSNRKAIITSLRITHGRRCGATCLRALANIEMLPMGSVIRISKMVAETKV
jgi:hypothetical protein